MKSLRIIHFIVLLLQFSTLSCRKDDFEKIIKSELTGFVQKGPFVNGTSVQMYELNTKLEQTGKAFITQINDNTGSFAINNISLSSQYCEFAANGYYYNEIDGNLSSSQLSLYALSDIRDLSSVNVNILTHLERERVKYLVDQGIPFSEAKDSAQSEVLKVFGMQILDQDNSETFDISADNEGSSILLAISVILQLGRSAAQLTELLANISNSLKTDGLMDNNDIISDLRDSVLSFHEQAKVRQNLTTKYAALGINAEVPDFESYLDKFIISTGSAPRAETVSITNITATSALLTGKVFANDVPTHVSFECSPDFGSVLQTTAINAIPAIVDGHAFTQVTAEIENLQPATIYYIKVKATNSCGSTVSMGKSFSTLGKAPVPLSLPPSTITKNSAVLNGSVKANDLSTNVSFEFGKTDKYGTTIVANPSLVTGQEIIHVSAQLLDLDPKTRYHYRVRSVNAIANMTGNDMSFATLADSPSLTTLNASEITFNSALFNAVANPNGELSYVTFEYGTNISYGSAVMASPQSINGSDDISLNAFISGLNSNSTYHYRTKMVNSSGTFYGEDKIFNTLQLRPVAITRVATEITYTGAKLNGFVNAGNYPVSVSFEYGQNTSYGKIIPAIPINVAGIENTPVSVFVADLIPGTVYHFRLRAASGSEIFPGEDMTFSTQSTIVTDPDGNEYNTVEIGDQRWMTSSLRTTRFSNGDAIPQEYYYYCNGDLSTELVYGKLYSGYVMVDKRGVCPVGWHVPDFYDWNKLMNNLGGASVAGGKLKEVGTVHWMNPNIGATNETGFTAVPSGQQNPNGIFPYFGASCLMWVYNYENTTSSRYASLYNAETSMSITNSKSYDVKMSIRCVQNHK
ncbi:MAG TPA: fibrobacter succinogenes major paralogous domain-containing protein [Bacteroidales bacterium]|nr:fibrobacter succinogenes major paralogous domain-containing protein [Bacteroidales bacterium]